MPYPLTQRQKYGILKCALFRDDGSSDSVLIPHRKGAGLISFTFVAPATERTHLYASWHPSRGFFFLIYYIDYPQLPPTHNSKTSITVLLVRAKLLYAYYM